MFRTLFFKRDTGTVHPDNAKIQRKLRRQIKAAALSAQRAASLDAGLTKTHTYTQFEWVTRSVDDRTSARLPLTAELLAEVKKAAGKVLRLAKERAADKKRYQSLVRRYEKICRRIAVVDEHRADLAVLASYTALIQVHGRAEAAHHTGTLTELLVRELEAAAGKVRWK